MKFFVIALISIGFHCTAAIAPQNSEADLCIYGGTPGGVACAVRAAREGLSVLLVNRHDHLGGLLTSGIGVWDSQFEGRRSPIYDEVRAAIMEYYRITYGAESPQYLGAVPTPGGYANGRFEPRVAEKIINDLVAREKNITVLRGFIPAAVERDGALIKSLTLRPTKIGSEVVVRAQSFADCTYEGDLAALAKVPIAWGGRRGRSLANRMRESFSCGPFQKRRARKPRGWLSCTIS